MRRKLGQKIRRTEEKLSVMAKNTDVMFVMSGEDVGQAKRHRYGDNFRDETKCLVVTFRSSQKN